VVDDRALPLTVDDKQGVAVYRTRAVYIIPGAFVHGPTASCMSNFGRAYATAAHWVMMTKRLDTVHRLHLLPNSQYC
jgi:hypothetical protein